MSLQSLYGGTIISAKQLILILIIGDTDMHYTLRQLQVFLAAAHTENITRAAEQGQGNLLDLAVKAARAKATVGEISDAMEKAFNRHVAEIRAVTGVYGEAAGDDDRVWSGAAKFRGLGRWQFLTILELTCCHGVKS